MRFNEIIQETSKPRPLYVCRHVVNGDAIVEWAKSQGLTSMLLPKELHVTLCYSKAAMNWDMPKTSDEIVVAPISDFDEDHKPVRKMEMFGKEKNILVLQIESDQLTDRWQQFLDAGASYDFPDYKPHITITYSAGELAEDIEFIEPYRGEIVLGPEVFKPIEKEFDGPEEELDLTKPLEELIGDKSATEAHVAETYADFMNNILKENVEWANGVRVTVNPSLEQIENLCDHSDLRGVCDGRDTFVWDAGGGTHLQIMHALGIPSDYYVNRFFVWMPSFGDETNDLDRDSSWLSSNDNVRTKVGDVIVSTRAPRHAHMLTVRSFARMIKDRRTGV